MSRGRRARGKHTEVRHRDIVVVVEQTLNAEFGIADIDLRVDIELMLRAHSVVLLHVDRTTGLLCLLQFKDAVSDFHAPRSHRSRDFRARDRDTGRRAVTARNPRLRADGRTAEATAEVAKNEGGHFVSDGHVGAQVNITTPREVGDRFVKRRVKAFKFAD